MPRRHKEQVRFPLTATLDVVQRGGRLHFKILREQAANGRIRPGGQICRRTFFTALHVELFAADGASKTTIEIFNLGERSLHNVILPSFVIAEMGGHNNGNHLMHLRSGPGDPPKYNAWLEADTFLMGQVVVITGYGKSLREGGFLLSEDFAKQ